MPTIKEQIMNDLKEAMRSKNELTLLVLRSLNSAIKNKEISLRDLSAGQAGGEATTLSDEQVIDVVKSEIKKRNDSIASYEQGGRTDLADKEKAEVKILEKYMPPQLSDIEIEKEVKAIIDSIGGGEFGKVMGQVMAKLKGRADGAKVTAAVKKALAK